MAGKKKFHGEFHMRASPDLIERIRQCADEAEETMSDWVRNTLQRIVDRADKAKDEARFMVRDVLRENGVPEDKIVRTLKKLESWK